MNVQQFHVSGQFYYAGVAWMIAAVAGYQYMDEVILVLKNISGWVIEASGQTIRLEEEIVVEVKGGRNGWSVTFKWVQR
ncbi:uncharacterized protein C8A04DRAFT_29912 [Dichotomopilus funicola]|uniref:Uncharacterized protein n=1 Tax=Dichotomopilus funicola TaxID=1934379 RepID=A0AAN6ZLN8_9PEZI|nr:hypothetical protein C8A04DRAFT_29912 [Dichotomopilus funicola]